MSDFFGNIMFCSQHRLRLKFRKILCPLDRKLFLLMIFWPLEVRKYVFMKCWRCLLFFFKLRLIHRYHMGKWTCTKHETETVLWMLWLSASVFCFQGPFSLRASWWRSCVPRSLNAWWWSRSRTWTGRTNWSHTPFSRLFSIDPLSKRNIFLLSTWCDSM